MFDFSNSQNAWNLVQAILVCGGFALVLWQIRIASEQNSISHLNHFRETWNSEPMLSARLEICKSYPKSHKNLTACDDIVAAFLEDLAAAVHVSQTNQKHAWSYFSYYIEIYWAMLGPTIENYQKEIDDGTYFSGFKDLNREFYGLGADEGATIPDASSMRRLIGEELNAVKFRVERNLSA